MNISKISVNSNISLTLQVMHDYKNAKTAVFKAKGMGCALVTHLRLTNSRFCILCVRMNYFEVHLMISSREGDFKVLRMAIYLKYFYEKIAKWQMLC